MPTYEELFELRNNSALKNRVTVAVMITAQKIIDDVLAITGTTTQPQLDLWAANALSNPGSAASQIYPYVLAANASATIAQITGVDDLAIQTNVEGAVNAIAGTLITS